MQNPKPDMMLAFIREFSETRGYSPSIREIGAGMGGLAVSHVLYYVNRLAAMGKLTYEPGQPRTIRLRDNGNDFVQQRPTPPQG